MRYKIQIRIKFLKFLIRTSSTINELIGHKLYDVIQNIIFSFVFVNLHSKERFHLFEEGHFCFICIEISCFRLNRYILIQKHCFVFQISNIYVAFE